MPKMMSAATKPSRNAGDFDRDVEGVIEKSAAVQGFDANNQQPPPPPVHDNTASISWNDDLEVTVQTLGEYSQSYKFMHIDEAQHNSKWYNVLMFSSIILGSSAGVLSGVGMTLNTDAPITFPLISSIVSFLAGLCSAIVKFSNFDEAAAAHKLAASRYTSLEGNVRRQLALPRRHRIGSFAYLTWLNTVYDDLFLGCPLISTSTANKFKKIAEKNGTRVPLQQSQKIIINKKYEEDLEIQLNNANSIAIHSANPVATDSKEVSEVRRGHSFIHFTDFNRYTDGMMQYELSRFLKASE